MSTTPLSMARHLHHWRQILCCWVMVFACPFGALAQTQTTNTHNPKDPLESLNRSIFEFNDRLDQSVLQPVAQTYTQITPSLVQTGVHNFFGNLSDIWSTVNNVLQFKLTAGAESLLRVSVNTVLGLGGVIDWASKMDLQKHPEDLGQTLGVWGMGPGPYLVLPVLGPSSLRDSAGLGGDLRFSALNRVRPESDRYELAALNLVDKRAQYLSLGDQLNEAALDRYSFVRDVYLQKRRSDVYDGDPPEEDEDSSPDADPENASGKSE